MTPEIYLIVATDDQNGIGKNNTLPWHFTSDLKHFAKLTTGHTVIMGRATWESLPTAYKPLPNRQNIVLTTQVDYPTPGAEIARDLDHALTLATSEKVFIIGGAQVFAHALATTKIAGIYQTEIAANFDCDTFFPAIPANYQKQLLSETTENSTKLQFSYLTFNF